MATISNVNGKKITKIKYKGEIYDTGGGGSGATSTLKTLLDATKSCYYLFYNYKGTSVNDLISYSDTENVTNMTQMFYSCSNLTTIPQLDTSNCTTMDNIFYNCSKLVTISQLNTSKCTKMNSMFKYCEELNSIPQLNTSSCTNMSSMFEGCYKLTTIPQLNTSSCTNMSSMFTSCFELTTIPQLDTSSCVNMYNMFNNCRKLSSIDITHMKITSSSNSSYFANSCYSLTKLIIRNMDTLPLLGSNAFNSCYHFIGTTDPTYNPQGLKDGRIYVPDDKVEALKTETNWSVYADIIVPLSTLVE